MKQRSHRIKQWLRGISIALLLLSLLAGATVWWQLRARLPRLDGEIALQRLSAPATIVRDRLGVVTIAAADEGDANARAGLRMHRSGSSRWTLMRARRPGSSRRCSARPQSGTDKRHRVHRFRARVEGNLARIAGDKLPVLRAYAEGVNAGLRDLRTRPCPTCCCAANYGRGGSLIRRWSVMPCISTKTIGAGAADCR